MNLGNYDRFCAGWLVILQQRRIIEEKRGSMLDIFITSRVRRKIVVVLRNIRILRRTCGLWSKLIKEDPGNIQRELPEVGTGRVFAGDAEGNTKIYQMNKQFPQVVEGVAEHGD